MSETTSFSTVYDSFLSKITDDMYMELLPAETESMLEALLMNAIHWFEFPKVDIFDYDASGKTFNITLTGEEVNIIATYMILEWIGYQLASVENVRMKYSGADFKFTSQANHLQKLIALKNKYQEEGFHLQRLYKRRERVDGKIVSTFAQIMEVD